MKKEFSCRLRRLVQLRRWHHITMLKDKESIYYGQLPLLEYIRNNPGCNQSDVANHFALSRAAVTKQMKRLLKSQLVERMTNKEDERQMQLYITQKGNLLTKEARDCMNEIDHRTFQGFSDEELGLLEKMLDQMVENLETDYSRNKPSREIMNEICHIIAKGE